MNGGYPRSSLATTLGVWLQKRRRWLVAGVGLVIVYALAGFLLLPYVARGQLTTALENALERPAALETLRINPFALSVEARGFALTEPDGAPLLAFDRLYANFQLSSLFRWAWTFSELRLEAPAIAVVRGADGSINLAALIAADESAPTRPSDDAALPRLVIGALSIADGSVDVTDRMPESEFVTVVGPIDVAIEGLSTLPETAGQKRITIVTEDGAQIEWSGLLGLNPLISSGQITADGPFVPLLTRYFQDRLAFRADDGRIALGFDYRLGTHPSGAPFATVTNFSLDLLDLSLVRDDASAAFATVPAVHLSGGSASWPERETHLDRIAIDGARLDVVRRADGDLDVARLVTAAVPAAAEDIEPAASAPSGAADWAVSLDELVIADFAASLTDRAVREPGRIELAELDLTVRDISIADSAQFPFVLEATLASGGRVSGDGTVAVLPAPALDGEFSFESLALAAAQPYVSDVARVTVDAGTLSAELTASMRPEQPLHAMGSVTIEALDISDAAAGERLVGWASMTGDGLAIDAAARSAEVSEITMRAPYVRLFIDTDGTTNFQALSVNETVNGGAADSSVDETARVASEGKLMPSFTLGRLRIEQGASDFTDLSLPLPFATRMTELDGELTTFVSGSAEPAALTLEGQIDDHGLAQIEGRIDPRGPTEFLDVDLFFRNVALPDLSPYTARFAGRTIADGRLEMSLSYAIEAGALTGENDIVISDLELGEPVEHPDALDLPLDLAVALMTGPDGRIDIDVPVRGNIGDPQFRLSGIVMAAFGNLITGLVTSPFRLLGRLVGVESEDFDRIEFEPADATLAPPEREKLGLLADALMQRPNLGLIVPRIVAADADAAALEAERVDARIDAGIDALDAGVTLIERRRLVLESLWVEASLAPPLEVLRSEFGSQPDGTPGEAAAVLDMPAYLAALRDGLVAAETASDADLSALGAARANAVIEAVTANGIAAERVTLGEAEAGEPNDVGWIPLELEVGRLQN